MGEQIVKMPFRALCAVPGIAQIAMMAISIGPDTVRLT